MGNSPRRPIRWVLYALLFALAAGATLLAFGIVHLFASLIGWLFVPSSLIRGATLLISLVLFFAFYLLGRRKRWGWLKAFALGGATVPVLLVALLLLGPYILPMPDPAQIQKPNQREPVTSPSGVYVLTVPIERSKTEKGPLGFGFPYWHVTIADPNGSVVYHDAEDKFAGIRNIYWMWGDDDVVWLYDSDDGSVYFYRSVDGRWTRDRWGSGKTGHAELDIAPPASLYPSYVSAGLVQNLGTPWKLSGFSRGMDPNSPASVSFSNTETGQGMMLAEGESENGLTVLDVDWDKMQVIVEIGGEQFTLTFGRGQ